MVEVHTKDGLKNAFLNSESYIKVDDPQLARWIVIAHAIKQGAWAIAIVAIAAAIAIAIASAGAATPASLLVAAPVVALVGLPGAVAMISLGAALGGVNMLNRLRKDYTIESKGEGFVILKANA